MKDSKLLTGPTWEGRGWLIVILLGLQLLVAANAAAPARPEGALMIPERFVRAWDPVTFFFDDAVGPGDNHLEQNPETFVAMTPEHPGVYRWLDSRTLQFRPADPWPPLTRFAWRIGDTHQSLSTLMAPATQSVPAQGAADLAPIEDIYLTFRDAVPLDSLARMISIDLHPLPGIGGTPERTLNEDHFSLSPLEASRRTDPASYRVALHEAIPEGYRAVVRLRLALDDSTDTAFQSLAFTTRRAFTPVSLGCPSDQRAATVQGTAYPEEDALLCRDGSNTIEVRFSSDLAHLSPVDARNLVRLEPKVDQLTFRADGNRLRISGDFERNRLYHLTTVPADIRDVFGRSLSVSGHNSLFFSLPPIEDYLTVNDQNGRALMERFGPKMLPLRGRGHSRIDLRIHAIEPSDLDFWPFAANPVIVDEASRPAGPGEEPPQRISGDLRMNSSEIAARIRAAGSPAISEIINLPLREQGPAARFGLDLAPYFERISGAADAPGTYLVGLRKLDESSQRQWVRVQVTDLSLSVIEEEDLVRFVVTSLSSAEPVANAEIQVAGGRQSLTPLFSGMTDRQGTLVWAPPGRRDWNPERIRVQAGNDSLVVDVQADAPPRFENGYFSEQRNWLSWTSHPNLVRSRRESTDWRCHVFTDRPIYRPEENVHIAGYVRRVHRGRIEPANAELTLLIQGPDHTEWRESPELSANGSFYYNFDQETRATGDYRISLQYQVRGQGSGLCEQFTVSKQAYRIPTFEVDLDGPLRTGSDTPFDINLRARYYAGGVVVDRPVQWRVTQFPYNWQPQGRSGYFFSSDTRFSNMAGFDPSPALTQTTRTNARGESTISIDPSQEITAQPRRYIIEATASDQDGQTVTATHEVASLPPFVLGLKVPRYLERADSVEAGVVMIGPNDDLVVGREVTLRLIKRNWVARLQASDFTDGQPRYSTEQRDQTLLERQLITGDAPLVLPLPLDDTGVYLVELSAQDELGRRQSVTVDLFNDADSRATWSKPMAQTFEVTPTQNEFAPGETATLVLQSPVAEARVLAIVEMPDGKNSYRWLDVIEGAATFSLPVERDMMPSIPVHFLLHRGRLATVQSGDINNPDLGKPAVMAASLRVPVSTAAHRAHVEIEAPDVAQPGETIDMRIQLTDENGDPLSGHVTLWLVDQAVLALGKERPLDPLGAFIRNRSARTAISDTRNRPLGFLPFLTEPGGDIGESLADMARQILDSLTVRERFETVPFFRHDIEVGANGSVTVPVRLPDNLTNFKVRVKATAGASRFGYGTGTVATRLPLIVQPSLPRFLRFGDEFQLTGTTRLLDGQTGSGQAVVEVEGLSLLSEQVKALSWTDESAQLIEFSARVPMPTTFSPAEVATSASITLGIKRDDGAGDAFRVSLPVYPDRSEIIERQVLTLASDAPLVLDGIDTPMRPDSLRRNLLISNQAAILPILGGLDYLLTYPHGSTEQRISRASSLLAVRELLAITQPDTATDLIDHHIHSALDYLADATQENGLVSFWPNSRSHLALTAWSYRFLVDAQQAGFEIDNRLKQRIGNALKQALQGNHSAYSYNRYLDRTIVLGALAADGELNSGYAAELSRRSQFIPTEGVAEITWALAQDPDPSQPTLDRLENVLWGSLIFGSHNGEERYMGLRESQTQTAAEILPSEARTLAQVLRALRSVDASQARQQQLLEVLVRIGGGDGWGTTNANAAVIRALQDVLTGGLGDDAHSAQVDIITGNDRQAYSLTGDTPLVRWQTPFSNSITLERLHSDQPISVLDEVRYWPQQAGDAVEAARNGFVVSRQLVRVGSGDQPDRQIPIDEAGLDIDFLVGDLVEEQVTLVSSQDQSYVAVVLPLAAGMEPLNPSLATASPEATPSRPISTEPGYVAYNDDRVVFYYDRLPAGTHQFAFRLRAQTPGRFVLPAAYAEKMYQEEVRGNSHGAALRIVRPE